MRALYVAPVLVVIALIVPAVAPADLRPHSDDYLQFKPQTGQRNNVEVVRDRKTKSARVFVNNFCLGKQTSGGRSFPLLASIPAYSGNLEVPKGIPVRTNGAFTYSGKATLDTNKPHNVPASVSGSITAKRATGILRFPGTKCGTIRFVAKFAARTP